jgi:hypothetical protein
VHEHGQPIPASELAPILPLDAPLAPILPVDGPRFRPCPEDVLPMIREGLGIDMARPTGGQSSPRVGPPGDGCRWPPPSATAPRDPRAFYATTSATR